VDDIAALEVVRTGGFAGIRRASQIDGGTLSDAQRAALQALFADPPAGGAAGADRFSFSLTARLTDGQTRRIDLPEAAVPDILRPLIR
jgi:hypothetical protein